MSLTDAGTSVRIVCMHNLRKGNFFPYLFCEKNKHRRKEREENHV